MGLPGCYYRERGDRGRQPAVFQKEEMAVGLLQKGETDDQKDYAGEGWKQIRPI